MSEYVKIPHFEQRGGERDTALASLEERLKQLSRLIDDFRKASQEAVSVAEPRNRAKQERAQREEMIQKQYQKNWGKYTEMLGALRTLFFLKRKLAEAIPQLDQATWQSQLDLINLVEQALSDTACTLEPLDRVHELLAGIKMDQAESEAAALEIQEILTRQETEGLSATLIDMMQIRPHAPVPETKPTPPRSARNKAIVGSMAAAGLAGFLLGKERPDRMAPQLMEMPVPAAAADRLPQMPDRDHPAREYSRTAFLERLGALAREKEGNELSIAVASATKALKEIFFNEAEKINTSRPLLLREITRQAGLAAKQAVTELTHGASAKKWQPIVEIRRIKGDRFKHIIIHDPNRFYSEFIPHFLPYLVRIAKHQRPATGL